MEENRIFAQACHVTVPDFVGFHLIFAFPFPSSFSFSFQVSLCIQESPSMPQVYVPDSLPLDSQPISQRYNDYTIEPTQVSQPHFSQTQTQGPSSQVDPRRKYCESHSLLYFRLLTTPGAVFIPTNADHAILKIPWQKPSLQIGRGPLGISGNGVVLNEKRISNRHCRITLGLNQSSEHVQSWRDGEAEPEVWLEDLNSSNGTFVRII